MLGRKVVSTHSYIHKSDQVRCLAFGAPPVFRGDLRPFPEITIVQNAMDGIIGASIKTTTDLFNKLVAINATGISRRSLLAMVLAGDVPSTEEDLNDEVVAGNEAPNIEDIGDIADDNEEEESISQSLSGFLGSMRSRLSKRLPGGEGDWELVEQAVRDRPCDRTRDWDVLGNNLVQMFVEEDTVVAK